MENCEVWEIQSTCDKWSIHMVNRYQVQISGWGLVIVMITSILIMSWSTLHISSLQVNSYPTVRGFTAIGTGGDDFVHAMVVAVESVLQQPVPEVNAPFCLLKFIGWAVYCVQNWYIWGKLFDDNDFRTFVFSYSSFATTLCHT